MNWDQETSFTPGENILNLMLGIYYGFKAVTNICVCCLWQKTRFRSFEITKLFTCCKAISLFFKAIQRSKFSIKAIS